MDSSLVVTAYAQTRLEVISTQLHNFKAQSSILARFCEPEANHRNPDTPTEVTSTNRNV